MINLTEREIGYLMGILAGEGSFGGDGKQPQITVRMHTRHARLFYWLEEAVPGSRLYGPYYHGGRDYYQWMTRGEARRQDLAPLVSSNLDLLDDHVAARFEEMCRNYGIIVP